MNSEKHYGRYKILEEIGSGAMGVVYRAYDPLLKRTVALKVLRPDRVMSHEFIVRFQDEALAIGKLSHPNIVNVFDQGKEHGTLFIVMELLSGESLQEIISKRRMNRQDAIDIGVQAADALDYAHQNGIIHRDIKPSNIIMLPNGQIKITDFGIAKIEDPEATRKTQYGQILGTPAYMSPEHFSAEKPDGRTDLFSLGIVLYEMITGVKPFKGANFAALSHSILHETPSAPESLDDNIPPVLSKAIMKSLMKNPEERFQTGEDMALELKKCLYRRESDNKQKARRKKGYRPKMVALAIGLSIIASALGVIHYKSEIFPQPSVTVKINSRPSDAQVFIDGILKGHTPMDIDLAEGTYEVRVSKPNFHHWEVQINLKKGGEVPLFAELMPINTGVLDRGE